MSRVSRLFVAGALAIVVALALTGCTRVELSDYSEPTDERRAIVLEGAEYADVEVAMGAGQLTIDAADLDNDLMEGRFVYEPQDWEPRIEHQVVGDTANLEISHAEFDALSFGDHRNEWDITLAEEVLMELRVRMGAGEADLTLGDLDLERLDIQMGAGDCTIDLSGEWTNDLDADIQAGAGRVELIVPGDIGVRVSGRQDGIGSFEADGFKADGNAWVNDAWGQTKAQLDISLQRGVGEVVLRMAE